MRTNTDGLVIREQNIGEADRLVTVLTRQLGVVRAFVRGARRIKNNALSATQLLCYSRFSIYQGRERYIIDEAEALEVFFGLRDDIERLSLAQYFAQLACELAPQEDQAEPFLRLLLNGLHLLATGKREPLLIKAAVELRLLCLAGYMPNLIACDRCGTYESDPMYFDRQTGLLFCAACRPKTGAVPLPIGVVTGLRHIVFSDFQKLFSFTLPGEGLRQLSDTTEQYLLAQTQRQYQTLTFYHSLAGAC